jgi:reactive intermediate/imine deaminase
MEIFMSQSQAVTTDRAPAAIGPYSQDLVSGCLVFVSGQLPLDAATATMPEGVDAQASLVLRNIDAVARAAGSSLPQALKMTVYLTDLAHFPRVNAAMEAALAKPYPVRATVQVSALPRGALVEIDALLSTSPAAA